MSDTELLVSLPTGPNPFKLYSRSMGGKTLGLCESKQVAMDGLDVETIIVTAR